MSGESSDGRRSGSSRVKSKASVITFSTVSGRQQFHFPGPKKEFEKRMENGTDKYIAAVSLDQAEVTTAEDITETTVVSVDHEVFQMCPQAILSNISKDQTYFAANAVKVFQREEFEKDAEARKDQGKDKSKKIRATLHWTFENVVPKVFRIFLVGEKVNWETPVPRGLDSIGITSTPNDVMAGAFYPGDIEFLPHETHSRWMHIHNAKVVFKSIVIPPEKANQILFRYRVMVSGVAAAEHRLRLEMLIIPSGFTFESLSNGAMEAVNSSAFPAIPVNIKANPIKWRCDDTVNDHNQFASIVVNVQPDRSESEEQETEQQITMPIIGSAVHARLLWEVEKKLVAGVSSSNAPIAQLAFWKRIEKDQMYRPSSALPILVIGTRRPEPSVVLDTDEDEVAADTEVDKVSQDVVSEDKETQETDEEVDISTADTTATPASAANLNEEEEDGETRKEKQPISWNWDLGQEDFLYHRADTGESGDPEFRLTVCDAVPNPYGDIAAKGKGLYSHKMKSGTKYLESRPLSSNVISNLGSSIKRASVEDVKNIHTFMQSSLAPGSYRQALSARRAFTRVMGSEDWITNPAVGDKEVILSRLVVKGIVKSCTALQYMKSYPTILTLEGQDVPKTTTVYQRMVVGLKKRNVNPVDDICAKQRKAHNLSSLKLTTAAFANMEKIKKWSPLKAQAFHTILLTGFWGRFRMGEILSANQSVYMAETVLLLDVDLLSESGKKFVRVWLRKEKAQANRGGSVIEIPKLPADMKDVCPYRAMKTYIRMAKKAGLDRFDPLFTAENGKAITTKMFESAVKAAVAVYLPNDSDLYEDIKNHSCRAGVPTMAQEKDLFIPEEILKNLGRWNTTVFMKYQKSFHAAMEARRFIEEELVDKLGEKKEKSNKLNTAGKRTQGNKSNKSASKPKQQPEGNIKLSAYIFTLKDLSSNLIGRVKTFAEDGILDKPGSKDFANLYEKVRNRGLQQYLVEADDVQLLAAVPFARVDYWAFDLAPPVDHVEPKRISETYPADTAVDVSDSADNIGGDASSDDESSYGKPREVADPVSEVKKLRKEQKRQVHPSFDKAKLLKDKLSDMAVTRVHTIEKEPPAKKKKEKRRKDDKDKGKSKPTKSNSSRKTPAESSDGSSDPSDNSDDERRRRKKKKDKKKKKKRARSPSSSDPPSDSDDDSLGIFRCKAKACRKTFATASQLTTHLRDCNFIFEKTATSNHPWGRATGAMDEYHIRFYEKKVKKFPDDNLNALSEARFRPYPASHLQAVAAQPMIAEPVRTNYPFEELGMTVANKKLVANLHYVDFKDFSLSMFSDENLARANVRFSSKSSKREPEEVANKETNVTRALIALNNYRVIYRMLFPGRLEAEIFFGTHLRRILLNGDTNSSMVELEKAFEAHILNKASAAAQGAPPANAKETLAVATANDMNYLMKNFATAQAELQKLKTDTNKNNKGGSTPNKGKWTRKRVADGAATGNHGRDSDTSPIPAKTRKNSSGGSRTTYCFNFNGAKGCAAAPPGGSCSRNGNQYSHRCNNKIDGHFCQGPHAKTKCPG